MTTTARKGDWIQTFTGGQFWPLDPRADEIRLEDVAWALSNECRFAGHCLKFYSVAEHSVHIAIAAREAALPMRVVRAALFHDGSEALGLRDMARPVKRSIPGYRDIEAGVMRAVAERFDFDWPLTRAVKELDERIGRTEEMQIMAPPPAPWRDGAHESFADVEPLRIDLPCWTPREAYQRFMIMAAYLEVRR